jgi:hypothetical protein
VQAAEAKSSSRPTRVNPALNSAPRPDRLAVRRGIGVGGRSGELPVSDIGILNDPVSLIAIALVLGSPGLLIGGLPGALLWRRHRVAGALLGAVAGFVLWLAGWLVFKDVI